MTATEEETEAMDLDEEEGGLSTGWKVALGVGGGIVALLIIRKWIAG